MRRQLEEARNGQSPAQTLLHPMGRDHSSRPDVQPRRRNCFRRRHAVPYCEQNKLRYEYVCKLTQVISELYQERRLLKR